MRTRTLTRGILAASIAIFGACDNDNDLEEAYESAEADLRDAADDVRSAGAQLGARIEEAIEDFDENADRALDTEEFTAWWNRHNPFDDWDTSGDDRIDGREWVVVLHVDMDDVDSNGDGYVTRRELDAGLFEALDRNDNGRIEQSEWTRPGTL